MPLPYFTVRVLLEAEDQVTKTLSYVKSQMETLGEVGVREAGRLSSSFDAVKEAAVRLLQIGFLEAGRAVEDFAADSLKAFAEFESAAVRLASLSSIAGESVSGLAAAFRVAASAAAREMAVSGAEAFKALESLVKAGLSGADAINALRYSLIMAKLEGEDYGKSASNLVQVMAQFSVEGSKAAGVVDVLVNASRLGIGSANDFAQGLANVGSVARAMGLSLEETTAWLVALERRLGSAEEAGTQFARLLSSLYEVAAKLGVPVRDSGEKLRSVGEIMADVLARTRELGGDFDVLQNRLMGVDSRAVKALFTLAQMTESFGELVNEVSKTGSALKAFEDSLGTAEGKAAALRAETDRLQRVIGESLSSIYYMVGPYVLKAFDALVSSWRGIIAGIVGSKFDQKLAFIETQLRVLGRISEETASQYLRAWVEMGEITISEALKIAEAVAVFDENIQALVEEALKAGVEVPESFKQITQAVTSSSAASAVHLAEVHAALTRLGQAVKDLELTSKALAVALDFYDVVARVNEALGLSTALTEEQAKSSQYLAAAQSVVNYVSQLFTLQQQALQLYMVGAVEAGNLLTAAIKGLGMALADGVVTQEEFVGLLRVLGVDAANVAGSLHNILITSLEAVRAAVEGNIDKVREFSSALMALHGQTAHTYHYHHQIVVTETGGQGSATQQSEIVHQTGGRFFEAYQRGAWFVPRTGPAVLHEGEMVLPRPVAEWFRRGGTVVKNVHVSVAVNASGLETKSLADELSRVLVKRVKNL